MVVVIMTSMRHIRLLTCVKSDTGSDIARLAQLNGSCEVNLITDAISDMILIWEEYPQDALDVPKPQAAPKQIRSPLKPTL